MASTSQNKQFWTEFIELYKSLPAVWKVKSELYKNRNLKSEGYEAMVTKLKEIDSNANRETVKKRINGLRTNYRRELNKIKESKKSGAGTDDIYIPTLWYFKDIDFLRDQETATEGTSTMDSDDEQFTEQLNASDDGNASFRSHSADTLMTKKKLAKKRAVDKKNELLTMAFKHLRSTNDEAEVLAKGWAFDYKKLKPDQQMYAKKAINDILFEAQLGTLHRHSVQINAQPQVSGRSTPNLT